MSHASAAASSNYYDLALARPVGIMYEVSPDYDRGDDAPAPTEAAVADPQVEELTPAAPHEPNLGFPQAAAMHNALVSLRAVGNEVRVRFIEVLRIVYDASLYYELGHSSFDTYCDRELGLPRSSAREYVRAARALDSLRKTRELFFQGALSWQQVRAITRVATATSEVQWLELAFGEPIAVLQAEVRTALRANRDTPRDRRYGLPNLMESVTFEVTMEDKERLRVALTRVCELLDGPVGPARIGDDRSPGEQRPVLMRLVDGLLAGTLELSVKGRDPASKPTTSGETIVYHSCRDCGTSSLLTAEGPIAVTAERIAELAPHARRVDIAPDDTLEMEVLPPGEVDAPTSARMRRQVLARDGECCTVPGCNRRVNLQAHHGTYRSRGGPTILANLIAICPPCHDLIHLKLLEVFGSPDSGLTWRTRPLDPNARVHDADELRALLRELEATMPSLPAGGGHGERAGGTGLAPRYDDAWRLLASVPQSRIDELAEALRTFGFVKSMAEERVKNAFKVLIGKAVAESEGSTPATIPDDEAVLMHAIKFAPGVSGGDSSSKGKRRSR